MHREKEAASNEANGMNNMVLVSLSVAATMSADPVRVKPDERLKGRVSRLISSRLVSPRLALPADSGGPRASRGLIKTSLIIYKQSFLFAA